MRCRTYREGRPPGLTSVLLGLGVVLGLFGCLQRTCTEAGCTSGISVKIVGQFAETPATARACLDRVCAVVPWPARGCEEVERDWRSRGFVEIPNLRTGQIHRLGRGWLEDLERQRAALDVRAACSALATPTLFVHGTADEAVPLEESEVLTSAFAEGLAERCIVPGANHTFGAVHPFRGSTSALETAFEATITAFDRHLCGG